MVNTTIRTQDSESGKELLTLEQRDLVEQAARRLEQELEALSDFNIRAEWSPAYVDDSMTIISLRVWCDSVEIKNEGYTIDILSDINKLDPMLRSDVRSFLADMIDARLNRVRQLSKDVNELLLSEAN